MILEKERKAGETLWFEYHCWESHKSQDAKLWYHSHQKATVLGIADCDGINIASQEERYEAGMVLCYYVRFEDGFEAVATEDELLDSNSEFWRPDPPQAVQQKL